MAEKFTFPEVLWAGTEHSLTLAVEVHDKIMAGMFDQDDEDEKDAPYSFSVEGEVGVVTIKGSLTNRDSWVNQYYGITSYAEIRRSLIHAANHSGVKAILLDIDSGGGAVSGVADVGDLIRKIDKEVKPIYAFTDGTMCSAAYWLGCSARKVYSSNVSTVGSIGVIATHMEYSKQLKDEGVGVTVVRAGQFKALLNSIEPATKAAIEQLQGQLNAAYQVFMPYVAECRGVTVDMCDKTMAQGREFFGQEALTAGLVDSIETFDSTMSKIAVTLLDNKKDSINNSGNYQRGMNMSKQALTDQQIAAIAAGVQIEGVTDANLQAASDAAAQEASKNIPNGDGVSKEATKEVTEIKEGNDEAQASVVSYLQGQIKGKDESLLANAVELKGLKDRIASMEANYNGLMSIAQLAVKNMKVALNQAGTDVSALSAESLLAEHTSLTETFKKAFKAGGVAAVDAASNESVEKVVDPLHSARIAATRF